MGSIDSTLTFGIELEYLYIARSEDKNLEISHGDSYGRGVVRAVLDQPLQAKCKLCSDWVSFKLPLYVGPLPPSERYDYSNWEVVSEILASTASEKKDLINRPEYETWPIEIRSRVLSTTS